MAAAAAAAAAAADPVHKFMTLIGFEGSVTAFLTHMSAVEPTKPDFKAVMEHIPSLGERLADTGAALLNAGAHGTIAPSIANPKGQIWKKIPISGSLQNAMNIIKEAFIQHMVAAEGAAPKIHGIFRHIGHIYLLMDRE